MTHMYYKLKAPCVPVFEASGGDPPKSTEEQERAAAAKRARDMERLEEQRARGNVILPPAPGPLPLVEDDYRGAPQPQQPQQPQPQQPQPQQPHMYYKLKAPCVPEFEASGGAEESAKAFEGFGEEFGEGFAEDRWFNYFFWAPYQKKIHLAVSEAERRILAAVIWNRSRKGETFESVKAPYLIAALSEYKKSSLTKALSEALKIERRKQFESDFEKFLVSKNPFWNELLVMKREQVAVEQRRLAARLAERERARVRRIAQRRRRQRPGRDIR